MEYYKLLGVEKTASALEIKRAYRRMAKLYHPDLNPGKNTAILFIGIKNAYDTLYDPVKRQNYDDAMCYTPPSYGNEQAQTRQDSYTSYDEVVFRKKEKPVEKTESRSTQLITFLVAEEEYAFKIGDVLGIMGYASFVPQAKANSCVEGLIYARGEEVPVINLAKNFGLAGTGSPEVKNVILVEVEKLKFGLIVDSVPLVLDLSNEMIFDMPVSPAGKPFNFKRVGRIDERIIIILELDQILLPATVKVLKDFARSAD